MKKHIVIAFAFFYASFNIGAHIYFHCCCDSLESISLFTQPKNCCDSPNCCHNLSFEIKIYDSYVGTGKLRIDSQSQPVIIEIDSEHLIRLIAPQPIHKETSTKPEQQVHWDNPIYLTNRVFLI
ncbi:MAG: hypothetical protein JST48_07630 [Bacteroidetes bacterium]|nr:hypothetical protein [Bacteroidota bacterium]